VSTRQLTVKPSAVPATHDDQAPEHQARNNLAAVAVVTLVCVLAITVVQLVRRFLDSIARSRVEPVQLDDPTGGRLYLGAEGSRAISQGKRSITALGVYEVGSSAALHQLRFVRLPS
jgi:hypothetical protein